MGVRTFVTFVAFVHAAILRKASGSGSEGWKTRFWEFRKMNHVLARAACDFEDEAPYRQDIAKDVENEIAITHGRKRVLAMIGHLPQAFDRLGWSFA